jgi:hypothetical protein
VNDLFCLSGPSGTCTDSHGFSGGTNLVNTTQENVYKIVHNFIAAAGENIFFGGANANTNPQNIEIRLNTLFKPLTWNPSDPSYNGGIGGYPVVVKNLFELKNASLVLLEGNPLQNVWGGFSQNGFAMLLTPLQQNAGGCPNCADDNITIRYNTINSACTWAEWSDVPGSGGPPASAQNWSIHDNVADNLFASNLNSCQTSSSTMQVESFPTLTGAQVLQNVSINHNTIVYASTHLTLANSFGIGGPTLASGNIMSNINITNNALMAGSLGTTSDGGTSSCSYGQTPGAVMIAACYLPYTFAGNCLIGNGTATWPAGNVTSVTSEAAAYTLWNNGNGGNYVIASGACKGAGTDSLDPGANIAETALVIAGNPAP